MSSRKGWKRAFNQPVRKTYQKRPVFLYIFPPYRQDILGTQAFSGIIQVKPWTKSAQSYYAGGSSYFILSFSIDGQTQDIILRVDPSKLPKICGKSQTLSSTVTALSDLAKRKTKVKVTGKLLIFELFLQHSQTQPKTFLLFYYISPSYNTDITPHNLQLFNIPGNMRKEHIENPPDDATYQAPVTVGSNDIGTLVIHDITPL